MTINIADTKAIEHYLTETVARSDAEVGFWLNVTVGGSLKKRRESAVELRELPADAPAWLQNKWDVCGPFHTFAPDASLEDKLRHIHDWLVSARKYNATFLKKVDDKNRPLKLLRLDLDGAHNAANKYFTRLNQRLRATVQGVGGTKTVMSFTNGSRIVQLLTPDALHYEGPAMNHCIGGGADDQSLLDGTCVYYSLRDAWNRPHATFQVEVKGNILRQCKGKQNKPPAQRYMPAVQQFVTAQKFDLRESVGHTGMVKDSKGLYHSIHALPPWLSVEDDLNFEGCTGLKQLPDHLSVKGTLYLSDCNDLTSIPRTNTAKSVITSFGAFHSVDAAADAFEKKYGIPNPQRETPALVRPQFHRLYKDLYKK